ncbi:carbamoyltransferase HypF, partial [Morganella morganii subsp. sibonii]
LLHNREIIQRADDSIVRYQSGDIQVIRRARGYVPDAIDVSAVTGQNPPAVVALGGDLKNTFCLLHHHQIITGPHLGDLSDLSVQGQLEASLTLFEQIYQIRPQAIAGDAHPGYISHQKGIAMAQALGVPFIPVYHHHAHIAACLAEHGWRPQDGEVAGVALDGLGYGADDTLWGGEILAGDYRQMIRTGGLPAVSLPGSDKAAVQPWRNLLAHLHHAGLWPSSPLTGRLAGKNTSLLIKAIEQDLNAPKASSCGRLFDAAACALGLTADQISWEGEAACALEACALQCHNQDALITGDTLPLTTDNIIDLRPLWQMLADETLTVPERSFRFHVLLANTLAGLADDTATGRKTNTVVLSGGVFNNRLLRRFIKSGLNHRQVLEPRQLPCGDGGIAAGQALIAAIALGH